MSYPAAQAYYTEVEVVGRETITAAGRKTPAIKLALRLQAINKQLELEAHKKFKSAFAWLSDELSGGLRRPMGQRIEYQLYPA